MCESFQLVCDSLFARTVAFCVIMRQYKYAAMAGAPNFCIFTFIITTTIWITSTLSVILSQQLEATYKTRGTAQHILTMQLRNALKNQNGLLWKFVFQLEKSLQQSKMTQCISLHLIHVLVELRSWKFITYWYLHIDTNM